MSDSERTSGWGLQWLQGLHDIGIDNAEIWEVSMAEVCRTLKIPVITKRRRLKEIHIDFDAIYTRLQTLYFTCAESKRDRIRGGIAMLLNKMFLDALLRGKLFEKGVLNLILPMFESRHTRQLAAMTVSALCGHDQDSFQVRRAIFERSNTIVQYIRDSLDDFKTTLWGIAAVFISLKTVYDTYIKSGTPVMTAIRMVRETLDVVPFLDATLVSVTRNYVDPIFTIDHAVDIVSFMSMILSQEVKSHPPSIRFLVAGLRSKNWLTCGKCLAGLLWLHIKDAPMVQDILEPSSMVTAFERGIPPRFIQLYESYNRESGSMKQADLILQSEHSIIEGQISTNSPQSEIFSEFRMRAGWLFERFTHSLPLCAQALRQRNFQGDHDLADILEIKHCLMRLDMPGAVSLGEKALERNPDHPYFYYAVAQSHNHYVGLRAAKRGLQCPNPTSSVKWLLLERAIHHGGFAGTALFQRSPFPGDRVWKEAIAILTATYEDAKMFVESAPPDGRPMRQVGAWLVLLTMTLEENISPDLRECKRALEMIQVSEAFSRIINNPRVSRKTHVYLAHQTVLEHFEAAHADFSYVFDAPNNLMEVDSVPTPNKDVLQNTFVDWLRRVNPADQTVNSSDQQPTTDKRRVEFQKIQMYLCSSCGAPSAALQKCKGCRNVLYCDKACQRSHWPKHKQYCKR